MNEQDLVIKNGKIQVKLDRTTEVIVEVPEQYKDRAIMDMVQESVIRAWDTVDDKPTEIRTRKLKAWIYIPKINKLVLKEF